MTRPPPDVGEAAAVAHRLAVLLSAGIPPPAAWRYLDGERARRIADRIGKVGVVAAILEEVAEPGVGTGTGSGSGPRWRPGARARAGAGADAEAWRGLAAAWCVAEEAGAPLAPTLRQFASSLRGLGDAQREIRTAVAAPRATVRLVLALPPIGLVGGAALGVDTLPVLATPAGLGCLATGALLMLAGTLWSRRLLARAHPTSLAPGLLFDLSAIALRGGGSLERARATTAAALLRVGIEADPVEQGRRDASIDLSQRAGVPAAELLQADAEESRRDARERAHSAAAAVGIRLMLPLGTCILPAFIALGVVPLVLAVVGSTITPW